LCSCSEDKTWSIWRIDIKGEAFKNLGIIPGSHMRSVYSINWSNNFTNISEPTTEMQDANLSAKSCSDLIATAGADNRLNVFEINRASLHPDHQGQFEYNIVGEENMAHMSDINCVAFGPSIRLEKEAKTVLATCGDDGAIKVWTVTIAN